MSFVRRVLGRVRRSIAAATDRPGRMATAWLKAGSEWAVRWVAAPSSAPPAIAHTKPLEAYFDANVSGPGIWKWRHYFDIYHRHLLPLRHRTGLTVCEIGIYSGGSLGMWREYFGPSARVVGVDIEPACKRYEPPGTTVLIGDQADPAFWRRVLSDGSLPPPDVLIDDGGHTPEQQRVTLESLLPHMPPGSVYICEDIHGVGNQFAAFALGLADQLNANAGQTGSESDPERRLVVPASGWQQAVHSVHLYPFVVVIEKRSAPMPELVAPKHGTQWEPFLR